MKLRSPAFEPGQPIPVTHTADGSDISVPLTWDGVPAEAQELALIVDDPDAPTPQPWVHWVLYKLPATLRALPPGLPNTSHLTDPPGALQGRNSWTSGRILGYRGPAPPQGHGVHRYRFQLYALDRPLSVKPGLDADRLRTAMHGHVLESCELVGTYQR